MTRGLLTIGLLFYPPVDTVTHYNEVGFGCVCTFNKWRARTISASVCESNATNSFGGEAENKYCFCEEGRQHVYRSIFYFFSPFYLTVTQKMAALALFLKMRRNHRSMRVMNYSVVPQNSVCNL